MNRLAIGSSAVDFALEELLRRHNPDGGFSMVLGGKSRPDATAWALLALRSSGKQKGLWEAAGNYLKSFQLEDGRVLLAHDQSRVVWVGYVAAWAWQDILQFQEDQERLLAFILKISGSWRYFNAWGLSHDQSLKGWSWVEGTSSWVDSTALALLALRAAAKVNHPRYREGIKLLKNRELPSGGWNCGNTIVYGTELRPTSESTGMAMTLLDPHGGGHALSVAQLRHFIRKESGPLTLAWALLAVGSEMDLPVLEEVLLLQRENGYCQTEWLSLLCMAWSVLSRLPEAKFLGFPTEGMA